MTAFELAQEIQSVVDDFADGLEPIQKDLFNRLQVIINQLSLDADGNIKRTSTNLRLTEKIKQEIMKVERLPEFKDHVSELDGAIDELVKIQTSYFDKHLTDFQEPKVIEAFKAQAFSQTVESLTGAGLNANVAQQAADIVSLYSTEGGSFSEMAEKLKEKMVGNKQIEGSLVSYAKQIVTDTVHGIARNYTALIADNLGLEWFEYVGALVGTSRDWCIAVEEKQWIHKSELSKICRGLIDGKKVSLAGLMPDTNSTNVVSRCGGYNCTHQMTAIPKELVPTSIRRKFEPELKPDKEELSSARPKRK